MSENAAADMRWSVRHVPEVVGATVELVVATEALVGERLTTLAAL